MKAKEIWNALIGKEFDAYIDYTGRKVLKSAFQQEGSKYAWTWELILPEQNGGRATLENAQIVSVEAYLMRAGRLTYSIDGVNYQVKRDGDGYDIFINNQQADNFWIREFGNCDEAEDFAGRKIKRQHYGNENSPYGWDIDHIMPLSRNGKNDFSNKQAVNCKTNDEKGDNTTFISENGKTYQVQKTSNNPPKYWANDYDYSEKKYCMVELI